MAAVSGSFGEDDPSETFRRAEESLRAATVRPELDVEAMRAPRRLAPQACALAISVRPEEAPAAESEAEAEQASEPADGRFVLLHDPEGQEGWDGTFRVVALAQADLEAEMAADPLLPEVAWSWLLDALTAHGAEYAAAGGTVSRTASHYFGSLAERAPSTRVELRASWSPRGEDWAAHLAAWCDLICTAGGLPPAPDGVVLMPRPTRHS